MTNREFDEQFQKEVAELQALTEQQAKEIEQLKDTHQFKDYIHDRDQMIIITLKQVEEKTAEVERLKNDLLDALDLKKGNGPTALTMLSERCARLEGLLKRAKYYVPDEANTLLVEISSALESKE